MLDGPAVEVDGCVWLAIADDDALAWRRSSSWA
jgi:hypothetical protein